MILTDYYKFEKTALKAKLRMDCTASTKSYQEFEGLRATKTTMATAKRDETKTGSLVIYYGDVPDTFGGNVHRKADKAITKDKNLSSVFVPDPESGLAYGDFKGTGDALLFIFQNLNTIDGRIQEGGIIEVFVARGKSKDRIPLYNLLSDGELDEEIQTLRKQAQKE
ncbi:MAG: hypothetical protein GX993_05355 [Bacteroidales bacterium]|nr:hypothetical protein [Bacteroidales bacterium]